MASTAEELAHWAHDYRPTAQDVALADRALVDTVAVALAAREDPLRSVAAHLPTAARWSTMAHLLDFDDWHPPSTSHISAVCIPTVLASGGDARSYLAGAGVMARLGMMLGWSHYQQGWHPTCTAGALAAAVTAAVSVGLDSEQIATAICLAVPAAGGVQRSFGSSLKSLQVGFVAAAGTRAAELVAAGATTDLRVFDQWLGLMDPVSTQVDLTGPAVPGGIAIKLFPCCYALQRPISAALELLQSVEKPFTVRELRIATPESSLKPLIHHEPRNGLEAKFSLEYGVAAAILDGYPGLQSFTTEAVNRPAARDLMHRVHVSISPGGDGILAGRLDLELLTDEGRSYVTSLDLPPGSPDRPATPAQVQAKLSDCVGDVPDWMNTASWCGAAEALAQRYPGHLGAGVPSGLRR